MEPVLLGIIIVSLLHIVGGITAFGSSLLSVAALSIVVGQQGISAWIPLIALCGGLQAILILVGSFRHIDYRALTSIIGVAAFGLPIGYFIVSTAGEQLWAVLLGTLLILGGLLPIGRRFRFSIPLPLRMVVLVLVGIIHGAFASGGTLLIPYARLTLKGKDAFRATLAGVWLLLNSVLIAIFTIHDGAAFQLPAWQITGLCLGTLLATVIGQAIASMINQEQFGRLVSVCMVATGLTYIFHNL